MRNSEYWVYLRDWNGRILQDFAGFINLEYSRTFNSIGAVSITVPGYYADVRRDQQIVVLRSAFGGSAYRDGNTTWFVTGWEYDFDTDITTIHGQDAIALLKKRIVAWRGNTAQATKTVENGGLAAPADNMVRAFVRENIGYLAYPNEFDPTGGYRPMPGFAVEDDVLPDGMFPITEKDAPFRNLYDVVREICDEQTNANRAMLFDVVPSDDGIFTFRIFDTWLGIDRSKVLTFGPTSGNMLNAMIEVDWTDTVNAVYVGGAGEDESRAVAPILAQSLFNGQGRTPYERSEAFVDMRDTEADSELEREGAAFLAANRAKLSASGTIADTPDLVYGRDYFYGDRVTCDFGIMSFVAVINSIHVTVSAEEETVDIRLGTDDYNG